MNEFPKDRPLLRYCMIALTIILLLNAFVFPYLGARNQEQDVTYDVFLSDLEAGTITKVQVESEQIFYNKGSEDKTVYVAVAMNDPALVDRLHTAGVQFGQVQEKQMGLLATILLTYGIPILIAVLLWRVVSKKLGSMGGNYMQLGRSNAKIYAKDKTGKTFADVAGQEEAKESLLEIVDFLQNPGRYGAIGARLPKGALLVGPPGTGKTLLAQAVAGEADVPFFSISGSEFVEMFVGMGAAKVRDLFKQANEKAPCIVFIDEIDTIGKKRDGGQFGSNDEREQTLNQLLAEMDGFDATKGVVILAATNRPETLDKALLRPGRFDRRIPVELPDLAGREAVLRVHAKKVQILDSVDFGSIARATAGASGAELANIINEAALRAVRMGRDVIIQYDLEESVEAVLAGQQRKNAVISPKEKELIAYHEVGHAIVAAKLRGSAPVHKITIIPRTSGALGYTMQVDEEEKFLLSREDAFNKIAVLTGGRCAEELIFDTQTTGASNDIEQATRLARAMITRYGMSDAFGMVALASVTDQYLSGDSSLTCSNEAASRIDSEVVTLIAAAHDLATEVLQDNASKLELIAQALLEQETLSGEDFLGLLNSNLLPEGHIGGAEAAVEVSDSPEQQKEAISEEEKTQDAGDDKK